MPANFKSKNNFFLLNKLIYFYWKVKKLPSIDCKRKIGCDKQGNSLILANEHKSGVKQYLQTPLRFESVHDITK